MGDRRASRAKDEPNLELPGLLGRRKRSRRRPAPEEPAPEDTGRGEATTAARGGTAEDTAALPPLGQEPHDTEPTLPTDRFDPAHQDAVPEPTPEREPEREPEPEPAVNGGRRADRGSSRRADRGTSRRADRRADKQADRRAPREATRSAAPAAPAGAATLAVGLVVGALGALVTWGSMQGCETLRGTSSCGGGPGLLILVAIFAVMVLLGGLLLAALLVPEPRGTSFLGVGILAVIAMLVLGDALFSRWMFVVVPLICAAAFGVGHWVTTRFVDTTEPGPDHDVR